MLGQGVHDRRHDHGLGDAVVPQGGQETDHVKPGERYEGRTAEQRPAGEHDESDGVEERRHREDPIGRRGRRRREHLLDVRQQCAVGEHDALSQPGGAAGIGQQGLGSRVDPVSQRPSGVSEQPSERDHVIGCRPEHDHLGPA
jgi:hypothetical protein